MTCSRIEIEFGRSYTEILYGIELGNTCLYLGQSVERKGATLYLMPLEEILKDVEADFKSREETGEAATHIKGGLLALAYLIKNGGNINYPFIALYYLLDGKHQLVDWEFCNKANNVYQEDTYYWTLQLLKEPLDTIYKEVFNLGLDAVVAKVKGTVTTLYGDEEWYGKSVDNYLDALFLDGESWYITLKYSSWNVPQATLHPS
jgi:hypothetical protein